MRVAGVICSARAAKSGPTESLCGTLTDWLKGSGMRWDKDNAESMMALTSLHHSGLWHTYWKAQRTAA